MQLSFCNLYCLVPSQFSSELDSSSEWSYQSWTCCAFIFYFDFLPYVFSGSFSGKEQTLAIALAVPCSIVCYHQRIQNIKAHCFFYSLGGDWGDLLSYVHYLVEAYLFIHISFQFCLNSNTSSVNVFLSFSDDLQLEPFAEQYQVTTMTWEMIKHVTNWCTNVSFRKCKCQWWSAVLQKHDTGFGLIQSWQLRKFNLINQYQKSITRNIKGKTKSWLC